MKRFIIMLVVLTLCSTAYAKSIKIKPKHFDFDPDDGFLDPGSWSNPYIAEDEDGNEIGEVKPDPYGDGYNVEIDEE